jgi:hypothetical protein
VCAAMTLLLIALTPYLLWRGFASLAIYAAGKPVGGWPRREGLARAVVRGR